MTEILNSAQPTGILQQYIFGLQETEIQDRLTQCLDRQFVELEAQPQFQAMLARAEGFQPTPGQTTWCERIMEGPGYRLTMLSISRWHAMPKHDHPHTAGVMKVLRGRLRIRQYELARSVGPNTRLVELAMVGDRVCRQGENDCFLPERRNIHELIAVSPSAVLISLQLVADNAGAQSWYFPLNIFNDDDAMVVCNRVEKQLNTAKATNEED
jgi:hypothetical protein